MGDRWGQSETCGPYILNRQVAPLITPASKSTAFHKSGSFDSTSKSFLGQLRQALREINLVAKIELTRRRVCTTSFFMLSSII